MESGFVLGNLACLPVLPILELNHKNKKVVYNWPERLQQHIITEQITAKAFAGIAMAMIT